MSKILKPYTIIPPHLYVQRDADRQVRDIITDMGRPGYVLVSRQMGKTNLLLNAKRNFESECDVYIYVDLSNAFSNARLCFENIIDVALDTYGEKFTISANKIKTSRSQLNDIPAHKQFTNELRLLLQELDGGKLVIILDEIDALTKTDYSDQIFSQIRSTYFASRVNYSEFYNLTYLLSGVVEPNEIIKDPKISPFNIGQKIYLNDFSEPEFEQFLNKAKLDLSQEVKERIFYWTNGNPRITWDVCADIEDLAGPVSVENVDHVVAKLYLTTFDRPPVDNIRELVKKDRDIRKSIIEINYHKGDSISDFIKSKLYLSGIINYSDDNIEIKNEIIRQSLSLKWLQSIEDEEVGLVRLALEFYDKGDFGNALLTFEKFLEENEFDEDATSSYYYYMGYSAYRKGDYIKALSLLNKTDFDKEDNTKFFYLSLNLKGLVLFFNGKVEDALANFKEVMASGRTDEIYVRALLNYCSCILKLERPDQVAEARDLYNDIIAGNNFNKNKLKSDFINEIQSIAYYNLALSQKENGEIDPAILNFKQAINLAKPAVQTFIKFVLLELVENNAETTSYLKDITDYIENDNNELGDFDVENPMSFNNETLSEVVIKLFIHHDALFEKIAPRLVKINNEPLSTYLYSLALKVVNENQDWETAIPIFNKLNTKSFNEPLYKLNEQTKYGLLRLLAYTGNVKENLTQHKEYLEMFLANRLEEINVIDLEIAASLIQELYSRNLYDEALNYIQMFSALKDSVPKAIWVNYLYIFHISLLIYTVRNDQSNMVRRAKEILLLSTDENVQKQKSNLLGDSGFTFIRNNAESVLKPKVFYPAATEKKENYGRNDVVTVRYQNGITINTKHKKIEQDILSGKCIIIK